MVAFTLHCPRMPHEEIDILVGTLVTFDDAKRQKVVVQAGTLRVNLVSIDDLIRMKRQASRKQDWDDITALKQVKKVSRMK